MCGFAGFLGRPAAPEHLERWASDMACAIVARGPDSSGVWSDAAAGFAVAHRRLAIVDVSPAGAQPMLSASGRFVLAFNGEIYNAADIKARLTAEGQAPQWRGHSDTEVLLAAIEAWGVEAAARRSVGMFAFAVFDRRSGDLMLARDRFGEKPLYYGWQGGVLVFGSDLACFKRHPAWSGAIDRAALALFMRYGFVPAPHSIYAGICKLAPGTVANVRAGKRAAAIAPFWSLPEMAQAARRQPFTGSAEEAIAEAGRLVARSVAGQQISDVPLGAFLSGGIDSSLVVATMQAQASRPVRTFTIGFRTPGYDEAADAAAIARHLGTDHTELYLDDRALLDVVPRLPDIYSEPFADASQIPTYLVSRLARGSVTVALSGDGGDEVFSGYDRYRVAETWPKLARLPAVARGALARGVNAVPSQFIDAVAVRAAAVRGGGRAASRVGERVHKFADVLAARDLDAAHARLLTRWSDAERLVVGSSALARQPIAEGDPVKRMMLNDMDLYLPDSVLTKVDRASMANSLEVRVPLLDHRLAAFTLSLPIAMLRRGDQAKWIARQLLARHVPEALFARPKMGFSVPIGDWLRGPLKSFAGDLLSRDVIVRQGLLDAQLISRALDAHQSGRADHAYRLWTVLMFQAWMQREAAA